MRSSGLLFIFVITFSAASFAETSAVEAEAQSELQAISEDGQVVSSEGTSIAEQSTTDENGNVDEAEVDLTLVDEETLKLRFDTGYEAFEKEDYYTSVEHFYNFVTDANEGTKNLEWGQFFLALSYQKLGLQHAAVDTFTQLLAKKPNPQITTAVLRYFEELSFTDSYDQELMIDFGLVNQDFGFVDEELQDFINYQQGLYNWRVGLVAWGDENFAQIGPESPYHYRAMYDIALQKVYAGDIETAQSLIDTILKHKDLPESFLAKAELLSARLFFELREFEKAIPLYEEAVERGDGTSPILLELAWSYYLMGDRERALGLLYAFQAPSYEKLFAPEYFILKAHIYKDVCYYNAAEAVSDAFTARYQNTLDALYDREPPLSESFAQIHQPLLSRPGVEQYWKQMERLQDEKKKFSKNKLLPENLIAHLTKLYDLKIDSVAWYLKQTLETQFEQLANQTLVIEEEMSLIEYEIGVQRYQNALDSVVLEEKGDELAAQRERMVEYKFQGEYWNDELDSFVIELENACATTEVWESF
jgi:hypothetical protein